MSSIKKPTKVQAILATLLASGSLFVGSELGKPQCDYIYITKSETEICLTEKEALLLKEDLDKSSGFDGIRFGGTPIVEK